MTHAAPLEPVSPSSLSPLEVNRIIDTALNEDLAGGGDVTSRAVVPRDAVAFGAFTAREPLVVAGLSVAAAVFERLGGGVQIEVVHGDGAFVDGPGRVNVATIRGPAHTVLTGERVALNLLQRMCGVATRTRAFVREVPATARTRITDTRKTTPGLRALERYAVRCGGGHNHRNDLGAGLLVKDNHIVLCGGVTNAVRRARAAAPHTLRVEIEVDRMSYLDEALEAEADVILLDNFDDAQVREAVERVTRHSENGRRPLLEVSGGVKLERIRTLAELGVDVISVGSLTHGARAVDIGLDLELRSAG